MENSYPDPSQNQYNFIVEQLQLLTDKVDRLNSSQNSKPSPTNNKPSNMPFLPYFPPINQFGSNFQPNNQFNHRQVDNNFTCPQTDCANSFSTQNFSGRETFNNNNNNNNDSVQVKITLAIYLTLKILNLNVT